MRHDPVESHGSSIQKFFQRAQQLWASGLPEKTSVEYVWVWVVKDVAGGFQPDLGTDSVKLGKSTRRSVEKQIKFHAFVVTLADLSPALQKAVSQAEAEEQLKKCLYGPHGT